MFGMFRYYSKNVRLQSNGLDYRASSDKSDFMRMNVLKRYVVMKIRKRILYML